ncbi:lipid-A-disaccharide synthase [Planctomyces sp. SH-PL62]|uniref:lipid-A-disaccharide synthase n=1 Tax=Planctomyces sp. SH-PL62 TaxID=1636152 RepID=UPI00078D208A|nr:lipid-A-disaccharide synthase [Planctomyces sp. SH-PL62]AMV37505.1 Lipid-A-disaccharide synthase [Planctomyces sp. SH-PL62]
MKIFLSAGEPSGDLHAANLIHAIRERVPDAEFTGYGGPKMTEAGATLVYPLVNLAVMWFLSVFQNIATFLWLIVRADRCFRDDKPDAVVLVDYPGLNWWIARRARARGVPVFYFVPPQLWAWAGWRVEKVRKFVDLVLCSLPFEPAWYRERGVSHAVHVGHPYFDELCERDLDEAFTTAQEAHGRPLLAILPGSRTLELKRNLPILARAAAKLAKLRPDVRFAVACLHDKHRALAEEIIADALADAAVDGLPAPDLEIFSNRTPELIRVADVAWSVSGSVSLELMMEALPTVILYKVRPIDLWIARPFIKAKYITLVNLLADAELMPEYLTSRDVSDDLVRHAETWLGDPQARARTTAELAALRYTAARPGATSRAAEEILARLRGPAPEDAAYRGPHARAVSLESIEEADAGA